MHEAPNICILIPILNESKILPDTLAQLRQTISSAQLNCAPQVVLIDGGSTDNSSDICNNFASQYPSWKVATTNPERRSVGASLAAGFPHLPNHDCWVVFLPADCQLNSRGLQKLEQLFDTPTIKWGGFRKEYYPFRPILYPYAILQNWVRSKLLHHLVWTNAIFVRRHLLKSIDFPTVGFLEDVLLVDTLRTRSDCKKGFYFINEAVRASARRYYQSNSLRRILKNLRIMWLFRVRGAPPIDLLDLYRRK